MPDVFAAVADPTRRSILEALRSRGALTLKALAEPLPMTRQAVTKHIDVLRDCGLVRVERVGRERLHRIDAEPLRRVDRWLAPYAAFWDDRLARLREHLNEPMREESER